MTKKYIRGVCSMIKELLSYDSIYAFSDRTTNPISLWSLNRALRQFNVQSIDKGGRADFMDGLKGGFNNIGDSSIDRSKGVELIQKTKTVANKCEKILIELQHDIKDGENNGGLSYRIIKDAKYKLQQIYNAFYELLDYQQHNERNFETDRPNWVSITNPGVEDTNQRFPSPDNFGYRNW